MRAIRLRATILSFLLLLLAASGSSAQTEIDFVDNLAFDDPESWAMKYFTSIALLTSLGPPRAMEPGAVELGFEGGWIPSLSADERRVGFDGSKVEDLNRSDVFGRLRVSVGLPNKFSLTLGWAPPVDVDGVEPNLLSLAIGRPIAETPAWRVGLRLYAQTGTLSGDITCSRPAVDAGNDPVLNPFGCLEPSDDEIQQDYLGLEASVAYQKGERWEPYFGVAINRLDLEMNVNARYLTFIDRSRLLADGETVSWTAGLGYQATDKLRLSGELFYTALDAQRPRGTGGEDDDLFNMRGMLSWRVR